MIKLIYKKIINKFINRLSNWNLKKKIQSLHKKATPKNKDSKMVLFWVPGGYTGLLNIESIIGLILKIRGEKVHFIICDGVYKACARRFDFPDMQIEKWTEYCLTCKSVNEVILQSLKLNYTFVGDYISIEDKEKIYHLIESVTKENYKNLYYNDIILGKNIYSAVNRHVRGKLSDASEELIREFAFTALVVAHTSENAIKKYNPFKVFMSHGVYVDWGPALSQSIMRKIPVVSYVTSYLPNHFYFGTVIKPGETFQSISYDTWGKCSEQVLTKTQNERVDTYIDSRYKKFINADMKNLLSEYKGNNQFFYNIYRLNLEKPVWGIMTHITWDSVIDYYPMVHESLDEWLFHTVNEIIKNNNVQWLIKIHPSERNDNPDSGAQNFIEKNFPNLPEHVKVIKMVDDISPLDFYNLIQGCVTVFGTGGLELALMGKPVILTGKTHYANRGFTYDALDCDHYENLLANVSVMRNLSEREIDLARIYAYCFFIQKQIPMSMIEDQFGIDFNKIHLLLQNKDPFVEFIYNEIIQGKDFVMDEKLVEIHQKK